MCSTAWLCLEPLESLQCWIKGRGGPQEGTIKREGGERNEKEGRRDQDHGDHPKFYDRSPPLYQIMSLTVIGDLLINGKSGYMNA